MRAVTFAKEGNAKITALYVKALGHAGHDGDLREPDILDRLSAGSGRKSEEYLGFIKGLCKDAGVD